MLRNILHRSLALILLAALTCGNAAPLYAQTRRSKAKTSKQSAKKSTKGRSKKSGSTRAKSGQSSGSSTSKPERSSEAVRQEQQQARQQVKQTQAKVADNSERTRQGLKRLETIEADIAVSEAAIGKCNNRITYLNGHITGLGDSIAMLESQLQVLKTDYANSLRSLRTQRQKLNAASFVFASTSFAEASKRIRYLNELDKWRTAKAKRVLAMARALKDRKAQLDGAKVELQQEHNTLSAAHAQLDQRRGQQATAVAELRREGATLTTELRKQQAHLQALNAELDRAVAEEVRRAEAERRRRAEEERRRRDEAARKQREAEAAKLAKQREEAARKKREEAAARAAKQREEAERKKREAEEAARAAAAAKADRKAKAEAEKAERKAKEEAARAEAAAKAEEAKAAAAAKAEAEAKEAAKVEAQAQPARNSQPEPESGFAEAERRLSGSFEANRGRLLFPVAGSYKVVGAYGRHNRAGTGVIVDNRGIDVSTGAGAAVRAVFDGEVVSVFRVKGTGYYAIIVRHGKYITVYSRLGSYAVKNGTQVKAGQTLGTVFHDPEQNSDILHFELRCESASLNPLEWIR